MKCVDGWWVPDNMKSPGNHLRRSQVIELAVNYLKPEHRRVVVQAGGHIGIWPVTLSDHFEQVLTWEPTPDNIGCLEMNILQKSNITFTPGCLGRESGEVTMHFSERNTGKHCVTKSSGKSTFKARMEPLDSLGLSVVDAMFLDVEGYEWEVVLGAEQIIAKHHPLLVLEQNGLGNRYGVSDKLLTKLLLKQGYDIVEKFEEDVIYVHRSKK